MSDAYDDIAVIGFDLDLTLYRKVEGASELIQSYIHEKIAAHRGVSVDEAKTLFDDLYQAGKGISGRQTLVTLDIPDAAQVVQEALEKADIAEHLDPDRSTIALLGDLARKYARMDLITGSSLSQARKKLAALDIPIDTFQNLITDEIGTKSDGTAFRYWMSLYEGVPATGFLYIGDNPTTDYLAARDLGLRSLLVNCKSVDEAYLCPQLGSLAEIRSLLL